MILFTNEDGTIDYHKCSDYKISNALGITQQRVRNLKVKNQLINPIKYDWKAAFATLTKNARYDPSTHKITTNIPDPNLYYEIQNFIEDQGGYVEVQLNSKIFQIRVEYYIELILALEPEQNRDKLIKAIKASVKDKNKAERMFDEKHIGSSLVNLGLNLTSIFASFAGLMSQDNVIGQALIGLFN